MGWDEIFPEHFVTEHCFFCIQGTAVTNVIRSLNCNYGCQFILVL